MIRTFVYIISTLFLTFFIAACAHEEPSEMHELQTQYEYEAVPIILQDGIDTPRFAKLVNDTIWALIKDDESYSIHTINKDTIRTGTLLTELHFEIDIEKTVNGFTVSERSITVLSQMEERIGIYQVGIDGKAHFHADLDFRGESGIQVIAVVTDADDRLYIAWGIRQMTQCGISVLSDKGELLFTVAGNDTINDLVLLGGNTPIALVNNTSLIEIDHVGESWGEKTNLESSYVRIHTNDDDGFIYLDDSQYIFRFNIKNGLRTRLYNRTVLGIQGWLYWAFQLSDETFIEGNSDGIWHILPEYTTTQGSEHIAIEDMDIRNTLTLAAASPIDPLIAISAAEFNIQNDNYYIKIIEFDAPDIPRLQTELAIGQVPDIIFYGSWGDLLNYYIPSHMLANRGLLADLYGFIDSDPTLNRDSFLQNILDAVSMGEALYELPYFFSLNVAVGDAARLGGEMGWSFDDMLRLLETTGFEGYLHNPNNDRILVLRMMLSFLIDDFIDWESGIAHFDSAEFQKVLEIVNSYTPLQIYGDAFSEAELIRQERQLMMWQNINRPNFMQFFDFYFPQLVPIGFPVSHGVGHSIHYDAAFSISAVTEFGNAAWLFVRQFYERVFFESVIENQIFLPGIPIHADALDLLKLENDSGFTLELGEGTPYFERIEVGYATEYDIERFQSILESVTRISRLDWSVWEIISEDAKAFFHGQRSAEETARIVQNRVQIYLSEHS